MPRAITPSTSRSGLHAAVLRVGVVSLAGLLVVPVALGGFRSSSFKKETRLGANTWNVESAIDGDLSTCWMVDPESENKGEWIEIDIPPSEVNGLGVYIGWGKDDESFTDYSRLKGARVEIYDLDNEDGKVIAEADVQFEDKKGWQIVKLPETKVGSEVSGGKVRIVVTDFYEGEDYSHLAVSEIRVRMKEIPATNAELTEEPTSTADGSDALNLLDRNPKTHWVSGNDGAGVAFALEARNFGVSSIGITPGPKPYARPKSVVIVASNIAQTVTLQDKATVQWFELPAIIGYTGSVWDAVQVKVVDTYPGTKPGMAISDVSLRATSYDGL